MKKYLSVFLTVAIISILLAGCGGSSASGSSASGSPAPEAGKAETTQAPAQEEVNTEEASAQGSTSTETAAAQEGISTEAASAHDQDTSSAAKGFQFLSQTINDSSGHISAKFTYYEDNSIACRIMDVIPGDDKYSYTVNICDREYDGEGKWISSTNYRVEGVTDLEGLNLDDYKTEENIISTDVCKYDDNGFVVECSDIDGNLTRKSTYNSQGQLILAEDYRDGKVNGTTESTYNEQGILIKTNFKNDSFEYLEEFTPFGATSIETLYQSKSGDNETVQKTELHYDDKGILTSADGYDNGELTNTLTFELDEYGNILHISSFNKDGSLHTTVENEVVPVYE